MAGMLKCLDASMQRQHNLHLRLRPLIAHLQARTVSFAILLLDELL